MNKDILLCGVGGQGTVLASKLIAAAAMREGHTVHSAETIGMAQRGGSVTSHIRIGADIGSPLIPFGAADMILAFEPAEAVRNLHYLKPDGIVIVNRTPVCPTTESLSEAGLNVQNRSGRNSEGTEQFRTGYDGVKELEYLKTKCKCVVIDGEALLAPFGSARYLNMIALGAASAAGVLGISEGALLAEIEAQVKPQFVETNKKAFAAGREAGKTDEIK